MKRSVVILAMLCGSIGLLAAARSAAAAPGVGPAATRSPAAPRELSARLLAAADADGDGVLTISELGALVERTISRRVLVRWRQLDRDHDGRVTRREVPKMTAQRFARFDLNRDGAFTRDELATLMRREAEARLAQRFAELDADGDARCTRAELAARLDGPARAVVASGANDSKR